MMIVIQSWFLVIALVVFYGQTFNTQLKQRHPSHISFMSLSDYREELAKNAAKLATRGKGILAVDESTNTIGKRFQSIGIENTEENRQAYRGLLFSAPGLGQYIAGAILFEETLFQSDKHGKSFVNTLNENGIFPGIKVDTGLQPLPGSNPIETW